MQFLVSSIRYYAACIPGSTQLQNRLLKKSQLVYLLLDN